MDEPNSPTKSKFNNLVNSGKNGMLDMLNNKLLEESESSTDEDSDEKKSPQK